MADDVLINKAATIERCVARAREEYARDATPMDDSRVCVSRASAWRMPHASGVPTSIRPNTNNETE